MLPRWIPHVCSLALIGALSIAGAAEEQAASVIVVVGAAGEERFQSPFSRSAGLLEKACSNAGARCAVIGLDEKAADLDRFRDLLRKEPLESADPLWLILLGHGTFDGRESKFNLRGDDLSASDLAALLQPFRRTVVIVAGFSSSGGFLGRLSAPGRVVITATKSGSESNYARFGEYFSQTIADASADLDEDGQVSLLEAWLAAAHRVAGFYQGEGRIATEHSLLDDTGDKLGTPADWFRGARAIKRARDDAPPDGLRAHQIHLLPTRTEQQLSATARAERNAIELELAKLRDSKPNLPEERYYSELEALLLRLAKLYKAAGTVAKPGVPPKPGNDPRGAGAARQGG